MQIKQWQLHQAPCINIIHHHGCTVRYDNNTVCLGDIKPYFVETGKKVKLTHYDRLGVEKNRLNKM